MNSPNPWISISLVLALLGGLISVLHLVKQRSNMQAETSRKLLHIGMGVATLGFPWLFSAPWQVVVLGAASAALMAALRWIPYLRTNFGRVINDVERDSFGDLCFPIAVPLLFVLSGGDPMLFCIPMLFLGIGDAVAALVGRRYGAWRYATPGGTKSIEGSFAFFIVAFGSTYIPLILFTATGWPEGLMIAFIIAVGVTVIEAIALKGMDNLFVPLGGFVLLKTYFAMNVAALSALLIMVFGLALFAVALGRHSATAVRSPVS